MLHFAARASLTTFFMNSWKNIFRKLRLNSLTKKSQVWKMSILLGHWIWPLFATILKLLSPMIKYINWLYAHLKKKKLRLTPWLVKFNQFWLLVRHTLDWCRWMINNNYWSLSMWSIYIRVNIFKLRFVN